MPNNKKKYSEFLYQLYLLKNTPYNSQNLANIQRRNFENLLGFNNGSLNIRFTGQYQRGPNYKTNKNFFNALLKQNESAMQRLSNAIYNKSRTLS